MKGRLQPALTWAAVLLVGAVPLGCGGKSGSRESADASSTSTDTVTIEILPGSSYGGPMSYRPDPAHVKVGQSVQWVNRDSVEHTATEVPNGFDTGVLATDETSDPVSMTEAGTFPYTCSLTGHRMSGTLSVTR